MHSRGIASLHSPFPQIEIIFNFGFIIAPRTQLVNRFGKIFS